MAHWLPEFPREPPGLEEGLEVGELEAGGLGAEVVVGAAAWVVSAGGGAT